MSKKNRMKSDNEEIDDEEINRQGYTGYHLRCRSIRIGSYKVFPPVTMPYVAVELHDDSFMFNAPVLSDANKHVVISLRKDDIKKLVFHFGRCLPIMFIYTTPKFGESVRNALHLVQNKKPYFDPSSGDDQANKLTFLIAAMTEDQKTFIRQVFPGEKKVKEINQKIANEILVRSAPAPGPPETKLKKEENSHAEIDQQLATRYPLGCCSVRIGSYTVYPSPTSRYISVILQVDGLLFKAPVLSEPNNHVIISLRNDNIKKLLFSFERCCCVMFVYTTPEFGEAVRTALNMKNRLCPYFDPTSKDDKTEKLTFLIETMTRVQENFFREVFLERKKVTEIDEQTTKDILFRSIPELRFVWDEAVISKVVAVDRINHIVELDLKQTKDKVVTQEPVLKEISQASFEEKEDSNLNSRNSLISEEDHIHKSRKRRRKEESGARSISSSEEVPSQL